MREPPLLSIEAAVEACERPAAVAASQQLSDCLAIATGQTWPIRLEFRDRILAPREDPPTVAITSLLLEINSDEPLARIAVRWREQLRALLDRGIPAVLLCTIFRYCAGLPGLQVIERIRGLNLLAIELSYETGSGIVDIDRVFAFFGARQLKTDYRLAGSIAAEVAAHTIVNSILGAGLDHLIPPEVQQKAKKLQGGLWTIPSLVDRRLRQQQARKET